MTIEEVRAFQTAQDEAQCTTLLQQVAEAGQPAEGADSVDANATPEAQEGQATDGASITVQQEAPTVTVDPAAPQIRVTQQPPTVTVRQPQPEIIVRQPAPVVTIDIPQPEIIVRMPQPEVAVQQTPPEVQVQQAEPQVSVVQPEQPQVQVTEGEQPVVQLTDTQGNANVQVEQVGEAQVTYERAEPQVTINQAEGQPQITVEQMEAQPGEQPPAGQDAAALSDSVDPNQTPEQIEGQAAAQPGAMGELQRMMVSDLDGMDVINIRGEQIGEAEGLVQSVANNTMYLVIDHGGFLGLGEKQIALTLDDLMLQGDRIVVPGLTDEEIEALPEFEANDQFPLVDATTEFEMQVAQQ